MQTFLLFVPINFFKTICIVCWHSANYNKYFIQDVLDKQISFVIIAMIQTEKSGTIGGCRSLYYIRYRRLLDNLGSLDAAVGHLLNHDENPMLTAVNT